MTRTEFQSELDLVERRVELLFGEVENAVLRSITALVEDDRRMATETISHDDLIDQLTVSTEEAVIMIIARHAPVASDLRYLLSVLSISSDLERCGDLSLRVAKQVFDKNWMARSEQLRASLGALGEAALRSLRMSAQAWSDRDAEAWRKVEESDVAVDDLYIDFLEQVRSHEGPRTGEVAVHSVIAGQALERIADHAVNISQRIRFLVTGEPEGLVGEVAP